MNIGAILSDVTSNTFDIALPLQLIISISKQSCVLFLIFLWYNHINDFDFNYLTCVLPDTLPRLYFGQSVSIVNPEKKDAKMSFKEFELCS